MVGCDFGGHVHVEDDETNPTVLTLEPNDERRRPATTWRSRRWPSRVTTTTGTTAAHGWSDGGDGGSRLHGARALHSTAGEGERGGG